MQQPLNRAGLFLLAIFLIAGILMPRNSAQGATLNGPQQMYYRAWQLVRDNYYDPSFNNQDWESWHHKYDGKLDNNEQAYTAIRQMLSSLGDQYTRFLDPKSFNEETDAINSIVCGIGISLRPYQQTHALIVNDVIETGPAYRAGMQYGDEITAIDGESTTGIDTEKAADKIRGKAGTVVNLTFKHKSGESKTVPVQREQVCIPSVTSKILDHNIGYIKLSTFMSDDASVEFRWALQRLARTDGLIIDMRENPGGLLANAIDIADMLMSRGKIVTTVSRRGKMTDSCTGSFVTQQPLVLLVDNDSASASEILAGALKDNARATVIGTRTYGKGLVQEINRLPAGAGMHITVARYYTPNGTDINKIGINPDVQVEDRNKQLEKAVEVMKTKIASSPVGPKTIDKFVSTPPKRYGFNEMKILSPRS